MSAMRAAEQELARLETERGKRAARNHEAGTMNRKMTRRKAKIALAVLGVVSGVLILAQRVKELYDASRQEYDDAAG